MRTVIVSALAIMPAACAAPAEDVERPRLLVETAETSATFETSVPNPLRFSTTSWDCQDEAGHALFEAPPRPRLIAPAWLVS